MKIELTVEEFKQIFCSHRIRTHDDDAPKIPKKRELATAILREKGPMDIRTLYEAMKAVGHPVSSKTALASMLSSEKGNFVHKDMKWSIIEQPE